MTARRTGADVIVWARNRETVETINSGHENPARLPGVRLDPAIRASNDVEAIRGCGIVMLACPAQTVRSVCEMMAPAIAHDTPVLICAKGIERETGKMMSAVVSEALPAARIAVLSGPSFAADVAAGLPTAVTLACADKDLGARLANAVGTRTFRPYFTDDVTGTEIGGAAKNVLAIASGIVAGRELGASASAALTTRGFAELARLGLVLGARAETLSACPASAT